MGVVSLIPDHEREAVEIAVERAADGMLPRDDSGKPLADESRDEDWALPYSKCLERVVRMIYEKKQAGSDQAPAMFVAFVRGVSPPAILGAVRTRGGSVGLVDGVTFTAHVPGGDQNDTLLFQRNILMICCSRSLARIPPGFVLPTAGRRRTALPDRVAWDEGQRCSKTR